MIRLEGPIVRGRDETDSGAYSEALRTWRSVLAEDPGNRFALWQAAIAAEGADDLDLALRFALELTSRYPEFLPGSILLGEFWIRKGNPGAAIEAFRKGRERHPDDGALTYRLALAHLTAGHVEEASAILEKAIQSGASDPAYLVARAICRARLGDPDGAMASLRGALDEGYRDLEVLRKEPLLAPLRSLPGFEQAVAKIPKR